MSKIQATADLPWYGKGIVIQEGVAISRVAYVLQPQREKQPLGYGDIAERTTVKGTLNVIEGEHHLASGQELFLVPQNGALMAFTPEDREVEDGVYKIRGYQ